MHLSGYTLSPASWSGASLFCTEASAKREWLVAKIKGPWEEERCEAKRRLTCFLLPAFLCAQIFSEREITERLPGTREHYHHSAWKHEIYNHSLSLVQRAHESIQHQLHLQIDKPLLRWFWLSMRRWPKHSTKRVITQDHDLRPWNTTYTYHIEGQKQRKESRL